MLLDFIVDCIKGCTKVLDGLDGRLSLAISRSVGVMACRAL
jgi:hypothetical protein